MPLPGHCSTPPEAERLMTDHVVSGTIEYPRHAPISFAVNVRDADRLADLDAVALSDFERSMAARIRDALEPRMQSLPAGKELVRDASGQILRVVDAAADPPAISALHQSQARLLTRSWIDWEARSDAT